MDAFVEAQRGTTDLTIKAYEEELERMLELKRERMGTFIENARAEINGRVGDTSGSNDSILRGLGTVGPKGADKTTPMVVEEAKPVINVESDCEFSTSLGISWV